MHASVLGAYPQLAAFVEAEWRAHMADDFAALATTPASGIAAYCQAFRADRALFTMDCLLALAHGTLDAATRARCTAAWQAAKSEHPAMPFSLHKAMLQEVVRTTGDAAARDGAQALLVQLAGVDTPKAAEIRAAMRPLLKARFGAALASSGGGDWIVPFTLAGQPMALHVDTGGMGGGFRYYVRPRVPGGLVAAMGVSYETALGLPAFAFDLLRSDRCAGQVAAWDARLARLVAALGGEAAP